MDCGNLRTFLEVVKLRSFSKAAETLFVTQSAISRRVKLLEEELGTVLIERGGAGIRVTPAGRIVQENAELMLEQENALRKEIRELGAPRRLSFACTHPFGSRCLPGILKRYMARYEGKVDLRLNLETPAGALQGLREDRFDLIVIEHWNDLDFGHLHTVPVGGDEMIFVSAQRLGLPEGEIPLKLLLPYRLYRRSEQCCCVRLLAQNMLATGHDPGEFRHILYFDDLHTNIDSILSGEGIAFLSTSLVREHLASGRLRGHRIPGFQHARSRTLAYWPQLERVTEASYFIDCILEEARHAV